MNTIETMPEAIMKETDPYLEKFGRFEKEGAGQQPSWLFPIRKAGLARFAELGFPTLRQEDWRFTNVQPISELPFKPLLDRSPSGLDETVLKAFPFGNLRASRLVFVNGHFSPELSSPGAPSKGVRISSLADALTEDGALVQRHLARYATTEDNAFAALNNAFFTDGAFIYVPAGQERVNPIHLLYLSTAPETGATAQTRNLILAESGSRLTVLETHGRLGEGAYFNNMVTEIVAGEEAVVEHCKFQDESPAAFHVATIHGALGRRSRLACHSMVTGARLSRNNIRVRLEGEGLECVLNGLYLTRGNQLADHHMIVDHARPNGVSHEYFNGILADKSRGVFHGRILVRREAQKTDAKQTNKNLLLSDDATIDTKPQLEIYADDVKCTHGATVGQLNEESIFYLRSRGIGAETARRMLIHSFAGEIIERIQHAAIREEMDRLIWERLEEHEAVAVGK
jgi:Fe-S cluster assembly protein SufD